jgi:anaerobic ribonucleoside-triphosphate reductase activating protein
MKVANWDIVGIEVPDEITLALNISNCPCKCKGCHSDYLSKDIGDELTGPYLLDLIERNKGITCVAFMGGDAEPSVVNRFAKLIKSMGLKVAWYSGKQEISDRVYIRHFDYIKVGPYIQELGGLDNPNTNQRMYKVEGNQLIDITEKFRSKPLD